MSRWARRKDRNHSEIRSIFDNAGCGVLDVAGLGDLGCDLIVWRASRLRLIEVKDGQKAPSQCKLTTSEARLKLLYPDVYRIVSTEDEAMAVVGELRAAPLVARAHVTQTGPLVVDPFSSQWLVDKLEGR